MISGNLCLWLVAQSFGAGTGMTLESVPASIKVPYAETPEADIFAITSTLSEFETVVEESESLVVDPDLATDFESLRSREGFLRLMSRFKAKNPLAPIWPVSSSTGTPVFDIPLSGDDRVQLWVNYLIGRGRPSFSVWLSRLTRFAPLFWPVLEKHGLPRDTIFLAMIESGFSPRAYSVAHAAGPWQFMPATGRIYGLEVGFWVDERRDFERATDAAARYLKRLHREFGDWHLSWAAYNAGEGRVGRALRSTGERDFWGLSETRKLHKETKHYVPKLIAAAIVAKNSVDYGFDEIKYLPPMDWETLTVPIATSLEHIAARCGGALTKEDLELLNPEIYRGITPPGRGYSLRVPEGMGARCQHGLSALENRWTYRAHVVKRGDTLQKIAKTYRTAESEILAFNKIKLGEVGLYDALIIPVPAELDAVVPVVDPPARWNLAPPFTPGSQSVIVHRVRNGDSLWRIANRYGVSVSSLKRTNGLRSNVLRIGQRIRILRGR